ncbi:hypothetical protein SUGI_1089260 [Cryptomeria japonica]|nr:hypothetical protein SUGI_1089260 [Cryptomeria japonica]
MGSSILIDCVCLGDITEIGYPVEKIVGGVGMTMTKLYLSKEGVVAVNIRNNLKLMARHANPGQFVQVHEQTRSLNPARERTIRELHFNYSRYSEELLRSLLNNQMKRNDLILKIMWSCRLLLSWHTKDVVGKTPTVMDFGKVGLEFARSSVIDKDALVVLVVSIEEFPAKDKKLVQDENVIVIPQFGASAVEAQKALVIEIAKAVVGV